MSAGDVVTDGGELARGALSADTFGISVQGTLTVGAAAGFLPAAVCAVGQGDFDTTDLPNSFFSQFIFLPFDPNVCEGGITRPQYYLVLCEKSDSPEMLRETLRDASQRIILNPAVEILKIPASC